MSKVALKRGRSSQRPGSSMSNLLLNVTLTSLLNVMLAPLRSFVMWQLFCGRNLWNLLKFVERAALQIVGYLAASPRRRALRNGLGPWIDIRRWHLAAGEPMTVYMCRTRWQPGLHARAPPASK